MERTPGPKPPTLGTYLAAAVVAVIILATSCTAEPSNDASPTTTGVETTPTPEGGTPAGTEPAVEPEPESLAGTTWLFDAVYDFDLGVEQIGPLDPEARTTEVRFDADTVTVDSVLCTDVVHDYAELPTEDGRSIAITGATGYSCRGSESENLLHDVVLGGLSEASGYRVDGDRLTLLDEFGDDLVGFALIPGGNDDG